MLVDQRLFDQLVLLIKHGQLFHETDILRDARIALIAFQRALQPAPGRLLQQLILPALPTESVIRSES